MARLIILFLLVLLSLVECRWLRNYGYNNYYGYGANRFWRPHNWFPNNDNRWFDRHQWKTIEDSPEKIPPNQDPFHQQFDRHQWNTKTNFEVSSEKMTPNQDPFHQRFDRHQWNTKTNFEDSSEEMTPNQDPFHQRFDRHQWNTKTNFEDSSEEMTPNQDPFPYNRRTNYDNDKPEQNFPYNTKTYHFEKSQPNVPYNTGIYNVYENQPEQNKPDDMLQAVVDQIIEVDKKIKSICNRGHNPSEEFTEEYYKRIFNVEGYIADTATVRIKHTVLYSCLEPVLQGTLCLEDVALLPENLIIEEAVYYIVNNKLIVKIPFKSDSMFMGGDVCRVGDIDEKVIIVSKQPVMQNYSHLIDVRNAFHDKPDTEGAINFPDD